MLEGFFFSFFLDKQASTINKDRPKNDLVQKGKQETNTFPYLEANKNNSSRNYPIECK